jgi:pyridoxal phosphate-dependent aminotransferase EpsN
MKRILLSVPHMSALEERYVSEAFRSNWISTVGPHITAFEQEFEERVGLPSLAVSSGTAAIHLGLRLLGVGQADEVFFARISLSSPAQIPFDIKALRPFSLTPTTKLGTWTRRFSQTP